MPASDPNPRLRGAVEAILRVAGPGLDLALACADRIARVVQRDDAGYALVRMEHAGTAAPRSVAEDASRRPAV